MLTFSKVICRSLYNTLNFKLSSMLLSLHAFTTLSEENKYSLLQSPQEKIHYRRKTVTKLTQGLKKSTTPSEISKTDCASNFSVDTFSANFRKACCYMLYNK